MNTLLVLAAAVGIASADVGLGYKYKVPHTSYGVPSYPIGTGISTGYNAGVGGVTGSNAFKINSQAGYHGVNAGNVLYQGSDAPLQSGTSGSLNYQTTGSGLGNQHYQSNIGTTGSVPSTYVQPGKQYAGIFGENAHQTFHDYQTSNIYQHKYNDYQTSGNYHQKYNYQVQHQPAQVYKHFYVHAAPEEPEIPKPRNTIVLPPPQKHYKIIFIKTPTQAAVAPQYVPIPQQTEEKTIVYVLVNKPEEYQDVVVPKVENKPPSKPEVYFIKYNSKEGHQTVINDIVNDYSSKGESVSYAGGDSGAESIGTFTGSTHSGQAHVGSGQTVGIHSESDLIGSLGSPFVVPSSHSEHVSSGLSSHSSGSSGIVSGSIDSGKVEATTGSSVTGHHSGHISSSTASSISNDVSLSTPDYVHVNTISTSQGIPHETYGVPKFRDIKV